MSKVNAFLSGFAKCFLFLVAMFFWLVLFLGLIINGWFFSGGLFLIVSISTIWALEESGLI